MSVRAVAWSTAAPGCTASFLPTRLVTVTLASKMPERAPRTGYFLNRALRRLALVARSVRLPAAMGTWIPVADGENPPSRVAEMLAATFPDLDARNLPFIALLTEAHVDDFERDLQAAGLLRPD